jgi:DNA modification methylase
MVVEKSDQLGQEETVEEFVENLACVFDEAKRVLKHDGSLFVNIADNVQGGRKLGVPYKFVKCNDGKRMDSQ